MFNGHAYWKRLDEYPYSAAVPTVASVATD